MNEYLGGGGGSSRYGVAVAERCETQFGGNKSRKLADFENLWPRRLEGNRRVRAIINASAIVTYASTYGELSGLVLTQGQTLYQGVTLEPTYHS